VKEGSGEEFKYLCVVGTIRKEHNLQIKKGSPQCTHL